VGGAHSFEAVTEALHVDPGEREVDLTPDQVARPGPDLRAGPEDSVGSWGLQAHPRSRNELPAENAPLNAIRGSTLHHTFGPELVIPGDDLEDPAAEKLVASQITLVLIPVAASQTTCIWRTATGLWAARWRLYSSSGMRSGRTVMGLATGSSVCVNWVARGPWVCWGGSRRAGRSEVRTQTNGTGHQTSAPFLGVLWSSTVPAH
jgi:hypothetical protein